LNNKHRRRYLFLQCWLGVFYLLDLLFFVIFLVFEMNISSLGIVSNKDISPLELIFNSSIFLSKEIGITCFFGRPLLFLRFVLCDVSLSSFVLLSTSLSLWVVDGVPIPSCISIVSGQIWGDFVFTVFNPTVTTVLPHWRKTVSFLISNKSFHQNQCTKLGIIVE